MTGRAGAANPGAGLDSRPLYIQVRDILIERIRAGIWRPGEQIPNEHELAAGLNVSQGTARKALDLLASEGLVLRRQGRGTSVVERTREDVMFRFLNLYDDDGGKLRPDSQVLGVKTIKADSDERNRLGLAATDRVIRIERVRSCSATPLIIESIALPETLFPGLAARNPIPNTLYDLFQQEFGILVVRAEEQLKAVAATPREVAALDIALGTPLLLVDRVAYAIDGRAVERRLSHCLLEGHHYRSVLG